MQQLTRPQRVRTAAGAARPRAVPSVPDVAWPAQQSVPARPQHENCGHHKRCVRVAALPPVATIADNLQKVQLLKSLPPLGRVEPQRFPGDVGDRLGFIAAGDVAAQGAVLTVPEDLATTRIDADRHELVGEIASSSSELIALTLWLCAERLKGNQSSAATWLATLPAATFTPLLWDDKEIDEMLTGSPLKDEAKARKAVLEQQWADLDAAVFSQDQTRFPSSAFGKDAFMAAFSVVLAHAVYLPSASCFALLPIASQLSRTGSEASCTLDYDADKQAVVVTTPRTLKKGTEVQLYDPRPNGELLLATGSVPDANPEDCLMWNASLLQADRYYVMKAQILESVGFDAVQQFPVYGDRFPNQLLAYLRLARVADPALFAKISFEDDVVLSQLNEYEILQILMGDCRERLQAYSLSYEEEVKQAQRRDLRPQERLAVKLRLSEKKIISSFMEAVRKRLAPIRGIPTKQGLEAPNSDLKEIFDAIEGIPTAPARLVGNFLSWAKGEHDPDWGKKPSDKPKAPRPW